MTQFAGWLAQTSLSLTIQTHEWVIPTIQSLHIVAISIAVGMIPLVAPTFFAQVPKWLAPLVNSGITLAAISAVLLNALFNGGGSDADAKRELAAAASVEF